MFVQSSIKYFADGGRSWEVVGYYTRAKVVGSREQCCLITGDPKHPSWIGLD